MSSIEANTEVQQRPSAYPVDRYSLLRQKWLFVKKLILRPISCYLAFATSVFVLLIGWTIVQVTLKSDFCAVPENWLSLNLSSRTLNRVCNIGMALIDTGANITAQTVPPVKDYNVHRIWLAHLLTSQVSLLIF